MENNATNVLLVVAVLLVQFVWVIRFFGKSMYMGKQTYAQLSSNDIDYSLEQLEKVVDPQIFFLELADSIS